MALVGQNTIKIVEKHLQIKTASEEVIAQRAGLTLEEAKIALEILAKEEKAKLLTTKDGKRFWKKISK